MSAPRVLLPLGLLVIGFLGGHLVGRGALTGPSGDQDDARAALDELVAYRGQGAKALRRALVLVDRIVAGGDEMLTPLAIAIRETPHVKYTSPGSGYQYDPRTGIISLYPDLRIALLEAVCRIGGDRALAILEEASEMRAHWVDRISALLFLARQGDRPEVRRFFTGLVRKNLGRRKDDSEMVEILKVTRGRLEPGCFDDLMAALSSGWSVLGAADEMAETLAGMSPERAGEFFLKVLSDANPPPAAKGAAARALARMPRFRQDAAAVLLGIDNLALLATYLEGLRFRRYGEIARERDAVESGDRQVMLRYIEESLGELGESVRLVREIGGKLGPERSKAIGLAKLIGEFQKAIQVGEQSRERLTKE